MKYDKKIMRLNELAESAGFTKEYLRRVYRMKNQKFARKLDSTKKNSPIVFDTEEFEKWRLSNPK